MAPFILWSLFGLSSAIVFAIACGHRFTPVWRTCIHVLVICLCVAQLPPNSALPVSVCACEYVCMCVCTRNVFWISISRARPMLAWLLRCLFYSPNFLYIYAIRSESLLSSACKWLRLGNCWYCFSFCRNFFLISFWLSYMVMCTGSVPPSPSPYMQQCLMCVIRFGCERSRGRLDADEDDGDDVDKSRVTEAFAVCCCFCFFVHSFHLSLHRFWNVTHFRWIVNQKVWWRFSGNVLECTPWLALGTDLTFFCCFLF